MNTISVVNFNTDCRKFLAWQKAIDNGISTYQQTLKQKLELIKTVNFNTLGEIDNFKENIIHVYGLCC